MIDFKVKLISSAVVCSFLMYSPVSAKTISVQGSNNDLQRTVKTSSSNSKPKTTLSNSSYQGEHNIEKILAEPSDNNIQPVPSFVIVKRLNFDYI